MLGGDPPSAGATIAWSRDGRSLLALGAPPRPGESAGQAGPPIQAEPRIDETVGKKSQMATFQDMLMTSADEDTVRGAGDHRAAAR